MLYPASRYEPRRRFFRGIDSVLTSPGASATVSSTIPDNAKSVTLTVTAFNRVPAISRLTVGGVETSPETPAGESAVSMRYHRGKSAVLFTVTGPSTMQTEFAVFDLFGNRVYRQSGERIDAWRYTDNRGEKVARGTYLAVVKLCDRNRVARSNKFLLTIE